MLQVVAFSTLAALVADILRTRITAETVTFAQHPVKLLCEKRRNGLLHDRGQRVSHCTV